MRKLAEISWIKQCYQKISTKKYLNPLAELEEWKVLFKIADKLKYKDRPESKETLDLFRNSALESANKLLMLRFLSLR